MVNMLLFSDRKKLVDKYYDWLHERPEVEDSPLNMLAWCQSMKILDIDKTVELARQ